MSVLIPHSIYQSAEKFPQNEAFRFNDSFVTYESLVEKAHQLAWMLREQGVKRGDRVGILLNRSLETAIAVYGILSLGAAFVPLDPHSPPSRLDLVIRDCGINHLISGKLEVKVLNDLVKLGSPVESVIGPETETGFKTISWNAVEVMPSHIPPVRMLENDLAYIMYTSGTTGSPKGIMHTHFSGLSYAKLSSDLYDVQPNDRLGNHSPLHFDISTMGYLTMPLVGGATVIIPEIHTKLPASMSALMEKEKLTIWYSVPLALIQLLQRGVLEERDLSKLRWVLFGGEPFPAKHLRSLMELWPHARFCNVYGPAEVNQCTYHHIDHFPEDEESIPLGLVWDNTEILILNEDGKMADIDEPGELLVRSSTRMKGYWCRPELTEKGFFYHEKVPGFEEIYYKTGDLVKKGADQLLYFLGRKDRQVKIRGYRVELDEVEAVIVGYPEVEETAVFPVKDQNGGARIEAAVITKSGMQIDTTDLKNFIGTRLPPYSVPEKIMYVNELPRTPAGKIDHKLLQKQANEKLLNK